MGLDDEESVVDSFASFSKMGQTPIDSEQETAQKLSINRYISFLDNVIVNLPKKMIKAKKDSQQQLLADITRTA